MRKSIPERTSTPDVVGPSRGLSSVPHATVVEDAPHEPTWTSPMWRFTAIAIGAVLAAIAFFGLDFETSVDQLTTTSTTPQTLADQVPDLAGTMHVIAARGDASTYLRWAQDSVDPTEVLLDLPAGRFNVDASQIATLAPRSGMSGSELWIGPPPDLTQAIGDVRTFAWHDEAPDRIAVTRAVDGVNELWLGMAEQSATSYTFERAGALPGEAALVGYGAWGASLSIEGNGMVLIVDEYANLVRQYAGSAVGQQPGERGGVVLSTRDSASIAFRSSTVELPIPAGGILRDLDWIDGTARAAVNVLDDGTPLVRVIEGDRLLTESRVDAQEIRWAPGARHIVITTSDGSLVVFDTAASTLVELSVPGRVSDAMVTES